jgi:hypothetical protein
MWSAARARKVSSLQPSRRPSQLRPLTSKSIPKSFASKPSNKVSNVARNTRDGVDTLSFAVEGPSSGAYIRYIRTKERMYMLTIEYPKAYRELATANKDKFFASFELSGK